MILRPCSALALNVLAGSVLSLPLGLPSAAAAPAGYRFDPERYRPVDTSALLGSPDPLPPLEIEKAFPSLPPFVRPVAITHAGDGSDRLFVCDQEGVIHVFANRRDASDAKVFLDIRERTRRVHFEEGLLGLAFHPRHRQNGEVFIYYSVTPQASVVSRWRVFADDRDRVDPESEEVLLHVPQPYGNHNGGSVELGPDGMLYVGLGDGGARDDPHGNGQDLRTLLGSILRIDIDRRDPGKPYAVPPDNPFAGAAGKALGDGVRGEIWAYGIRNPWRLTFDRLTGDCWIGDVGQDLWEEVDIIVKGGNYGWNLREGRHPFKGAESPEGAAFIEPVLEYPRQDGKSITGGLVYRGTRLPQLFGTYLYADFVTFNVWGLRYDGEKATNQLIARSTLPIAAFGEDEEGEVYICAFDAAPGVDIRSLDAGKVYNLRQGSIYRLRLREGPDVDPDRFPRLLSQTGLFTDVRSLAPAPGLIPYSVNVPLWSDGAEKERYIALPPGGKIAFSESGHWGFPVGTVLVKTFTLESCEPATPHRLETRLLVRSERGWSGYTYLWNDERSDARLLDAALVRSYAVERDLRHWEQAWYFPSRSDCNACHTQVAGHVLGLNTRQMNRLHDYGGWSKGQLAVLAGLGVFEEPPPAARDLESFPEWGRESAPIDRRARAYLDVNCAICHAPGGTGVARADLRWSTPLERTHTVGQEPGQGRTGGPGSQVIAPGAPQRSELLLRMLASGPGRMPTLASSRVDWEAVRAIGEWIEGLGEE